MQRILITGGCGFIGSNFVRWALSEYPDVSIANIDNDGESEVIIGSAVLVLLPETMGALGRYMALVFSLLLLVFVVVSRYPSITAQTG